MIIVRRKIKDLYFWCHLMVFLSHDTNLSVSAWFRKQNRTVKKLWPFSWSLKGRCFSCGVLTGFLSSSPGLSEGAAPAAHGYAAGCHRSHTLKLASQLSWWFNNTFWRENSLSWVIMRVSAACTKSEIFKFFTRKEEIVLPLTWGLPCWVLPSCLETSCFLQQ